MGRGLRAPRQACPMGTIKYRQRPPGTEVGRSGRNLFRGPLALVLGISPPEQLDRTCCYSKGYGKKGAADRERGVPGACRLRWAPVAELLGRTWSVGISLQCGNEPKTLSTLKTRDET